MKKVFLSMLLMGTMALFIGCGDNGAGSDDTATIKIMTAPEGAGTEVDLMNLVPGAVETVYAVAFDDVSNDYVEDVELDAATISGTVGTATPITVNATLGIGGDQAIQITVNSISAPSGLESVTKDGAIDLNWTASAGTVSGYNVYRSTDSTDMSVVLGTADTSNYSDMTAVNGTKYFYAVAAMGSGDLVITPSSADYSAKTFASEVVSAQTAVVDDAARPYDEPADAIWEFDSVGKSSFGWTFNGTGYVISTSSSKADSIDLYVAFESGNLVMGSPDLKISTGNPTTTFFADMGAHGFDDPEVSDASSVAAWSTKVNLVQGHVYAIKLAEGYYIKMIVDELDQDTASDYYIYISYGFQTLQNYTNFKAAAK